MVLETVPARSVVDVGCGVGTWGKQFIDNGVAEFTGIDGPHVDPELLKIPAQWFIAHDLETPLRLDRTFDLAVSLEVAEHLSPQRAASFVSDLCALAPAVLFSAAIPGQWGTNHRNERWPEYWRALFEALRFEPYDCLRRRIWWDERIEPWYRQNLLLYARTDDREKYAHLDCRGPLSLVHPRTLEKYRKGHHSLVVPSIRAGFRSLWRAARRLPVAWR
ncbi:MAG: class I SAM-dependent methyltransferase [Bryobacteraceae bacterium]|jgi:SAM-dependent methyltransferase